LAGCRFIGILCGLELLQQVVGNSKPVENRRVALRRRNFLVSIDRIGVLLLIELLVSGRSLTKQTCAEQENDCYGPLHIGPDFTVLSRVTLALCRAVRPPARTRISARRHAFRLRVWQ